MNNQKKILLVDDEPNIIMSLDFLFRKEGYTVLIARNGQEALQAYKAEQPDAMILDIMMPDIDGYEVCKQVRSVASKEKCKIIFLSAKSKETDIQKGMDIGADAYLTKPFSTKTIKTEIQNLLTN